MGRAARARAALAPLRAVTMGKVAMKMREVIYTISPNRLNTMSSLFRDGASSIMHLVKDTWFPVACGAVPLVATLSFADWYSNAEKLSHRHWASGGGSISALCCLRCGAGERRGGRLMATSRQYKEPFFGQNISPSEIGAYFCVVTG